MKGGQLFWGILFLTIGSLLLIDNFYEFHFNIYKYYDLWPIVLIFFGLYFIFRNSFLKWIFIIANAFIVSLLIFSFFNNDMNVRIHDFDDIEITESNSEIFSHSFNSNINEAVLKFNGAIGKVVLNDTSDDLINIKAKNVFGSNYFYVDTTENKARIEFVNKHNSGKFKLDKVKGNFSEIKLNKNVNWDLKFDIDAASADLDLSKFKTNFIKFESGVSKISLVLGNISDFTKVNFESGVSKINIKIPKTSACQINYESDLSKKNFIGFNKIDDHTYQSENFEDEDKKIIIDLNADVSSIKIERY